MATKCISLREGIHGQIPFARPIFDFQQANRFFSMVFDSLAGKIAVTAADFSARAGNALPEIFWKYSVFGGSTSVTLYPDRLLFDFANLVPTDYPIARQVIEAIYDGFSPAFPEVSFDRVDVQSYAHLALLPSVTVDELLQRYEIKSVIAAFPEKVVHRPGAKFEVISEDQRWQCACTIERSLLQTTAIFMALQISVRKVTPQIRFSELSESVREIRKSCLSGLGLELEDVATG